MAGADLDLDEGGVSGKVLAPKDDGGLMAEVRFGDATGCCRGDCVRTEVLSSFVPLTPDGGVGDPGPEPFPFWLNLLEVSTFPMWVVRTVLLGDPAPPLQLELLHRFPLEAPSEDRLWCAMVAIVVVVDPLVAVVPLWVECLIDESCV